MMLIESCCVIWSSVKCNGVNCVICLEFFSALFAFQLHAYTSLNSQAPSGIAPIE